MHVPTTANHITGIVESNYHKILIFSPPKSLKSLRAARIDQLADSNEPAIKNPFKKVVTQCQKSIARMWKVVNAIQNISIHLCGTKQSVFKVEKFYNYCLLRTIIYEGFDRRETTSRGDWRTSSMDPHHIICLMQ